MVIQGRLNGSWVKIKWKPGYGGEFCYGTNTIKLGRCINTWIDLYNVLLHEAIEMSAGYKSLRYYKNDVAARGDSDIHFIMTHEEFTDCVADAGYFISNVIEQLKKEWKKNHVK